MAVTPFSKGTKLALHVASSSTRNPKPLVLLSGWMGATSRHLRRFNEAYQERGFDTLSFSAGPQQVLNPQKAISLMETNMDAVTAELERTNTDGNTRPVIFHGFSMSGFLWGNALLSMDKDPQRFDLFKRSLRAQVFDSPPDFNGIAGGMARSMGFGGVREAAVRSVVSMYLSATKDTAGVHHQASSKRFHENDLTSVPSLWFYSRSDPVARWQDCAQVIQEWRQAGIEVDEVVFEDTPHVQHMLLEPHKYLAGLDDFFQKHGLLR